jgi:hypothetical protein
VRGGEDSKLTSYEFGYKHEYTLYKQEYLQKHEYMIIHEYLYDHDYSYMALKNTTNEKGVQE